MGSIVVKVAVVVVVEMVMLPVVVTLVLMSLVVVALLVVAMVVEVSQWNEFFGGRKFVVATISNGTRCGGCCSDTCDKDGQNNYNESSSDNKKTIRME